MRTFPTLFFLCSQIFCIPQIDPNAFNSTCSTDDDCTGNLICGGSSGNLCSSCGPQLGDNNGCNNLFQSICGNCITGIESISSSGFFCLSNCA